MDGRTLKVLAVGIVVGAGVSLTALGAAAAMGGWHAGVTASRTYSMSLLARPVQAQNPFETPLPHELVPVPPPPDNGRSFGPGPQSPGAGGNNLGPGSSAPGGGQDCQQILFYYQGRLYQLRPPQGDQNPEFFFMQPYNGPQLPGFPGPTPPGLNLPAPSVPSLPPTFKF
jgi:hypothetical protein